MSRMGIRSHSSCHFLFLEFCVILFLSSIVCSLSSTSNFKPVYANVRGVSRNQRNLQLARVSRSTDMVDSVFNFDFKWDKEPPEFINQFDLEVKWVDENDAKPTKVSIHNVTMDHDLSVPITQLVTSLASKLFDEMPLEKNKSIDVIDIPLNISVSSTTIPKNFSCEELHVLFKSLKVSKGEISQRGRRGRRGFKGDKGEPSLAIVGPKGEPGDPGLLPHHLLYPETARLKGEPGARGLPGVCPSRCSSTNPTLPPPANIQSKPTQNSRSTSISQPSYRIVPGALVFRSLPSLLQMSVHARLGSVAFVEESEKFYGKVQQGWRQFQMGPIIT